MFLNYLIYKLTQLFHCCNITGMFAMTFEDNNGERLSVPGEITFSYPIDQFGNDTDLSEVRVWTMNPDTGEKGFYNSLP